MFARLPVPCLFINVMVPQISALYLHCAININHIFQHTLYARLIQSILPMQNITPSGGNTFFPSPRFQLILCHTFVLCNDTVAYAQMVGRAFAFHTLRNSLRSLLCCRKAPSPSSPLGSIAIFRHHPLLDLPMPLLRSA